VQRLGYLLAAELQTSIDAIIASLREPHLTGNPVVTMTVPVTQGQTLIVWLLTGSQSFQAQPSAHGLGARQSRRVIETTHERTGERISVSMLSSVAGLSRSHFSHAFRASAGRTPHRQIVSLGIEHAVKLVARSGVPLSDIALAAGFSDQAHFSNTLAGQWGKRRMSGGGPSLMTAGYAEFPTFLKTLRRRIPPDAFTLGDWRRLPARCGRRVTQEEAAEAVGVSRNWYRRLESCASVRASPKLLDRLATAFAVTPAERTKLFVLGIPEMC
jgi:AraC-like DNA-binding protein/DNA-binding XRE family transcriptional regulator